MSFQDEVYLIADELRSIANAGVFYARNEYDRERYDRALSLSARGNLSNRAVDRYANCVLAVCLRAHSSVG